MAYDIFNIDAMNLGDVSGKEVNTLFSIVFPIIKNLVNGKIKNGFPLPLPTGFELAHFSVEEHPGYLYIEADPTYKPVMLS